MLLLMQNLKANKSFLKLDFYKLEKIRVIGKLHKSTSILAAKFQKEESPYCSVPISNKPSTGTLVLMQDIYSHY